MDNLTLAACAAFLTAAAVLGSMAWLGHVVQ